MQIILVVKSEIPLLFVGCSYTKSVLADEWNYATT